jgi:hypothetical protein
MQEKKNTRHDDTCRPVCEHRHEKYYPQAEHRKVQDVELGMYVHSSILMCWYFLFFFYASLFFFSHDTPSDHLDG